MRSPTPRAGRSARVLAPLACLALLTACGQVTQTALPEQPAATRTDRPEPGTPTSTAEVDVQRDGIEPAIVTAVRFAGHGTYDRVVIDLKGKVPGYSVQWVDELAGDGSGKPMNVRGGAYLQVTLFPANAHDAKGRLTWNGGPVFRTGLRNLTDVVRTGDFESRVGIGLVLARKAAFQVKEQGGAGRLIIDVAH
ncbi:hypothetical protein [Nonomuraea sp. NPDC005650]|uniref:AMIN-like domain-containing (lipo)protein n=1 Tax=Nonomuraea sp. NPDC005650 TaxID=3157045 RepID=UPI0033BCC292